MAQISKWVCLVCLLLIIALAFLAYQVPLEFLPRNVLISGIIFLVCCLSLFALLGLDNPLFSLPRTQIATVTTLLAVFITAELVFWGVASDPSKFWGAVFAGWVASLGFFLVVGAVVTLATLAKPGSESFDARARILFRNQDGPHIDYIVAWVKETFQQYAELSETRFFFDEYSAGSSKIRLRVEDEITIKSYIDDVTSNFESEIKMWEITEAPKDGKPSRFHYLRLNDQPKVDPHDISNEVHHKFSTEIAPAGRCVVAHRIDTWMLANEEDYEHTPTRYTKALRISFENNFQNGERVSIKLERHGHQKQEFELAPGDRIGGLELVNLKPGELAYRFTLAVV